MLESLRAYGTDRLASGDEQLDAAAALAAYALQVAEDAAPATRPGPMSERRFAGWTPKRRPCRRD
jgi:hypothetical protein